MRIVCIIIAMWALMVPAMSQTALPVGWRPIHDQKGSWLRIDLDGDGKLDQAVLATDGHKKKAFAILAQKQGPQVIELIECGETSRSCLFETLQPGRYVTACG